MTPKQKKLLLYIGGGTALAALTIYAIKKGAANNPDILTASLPGGAKSKPLAPVAVSQPTPTCSWCATAYPAPQPAPSPTVKAMINPGVFVPIQAAPLVPIAQPVPAPQPAPAPLVPIAQPVPKPAPIPSYITPTVAIQPAPAPAPSPTLSTAKAPNTTYTQPVIYSQPVVYSGGSSTGTVKDSQQMKGLNGFLLI